MQWFTNYWGDYICYGPSIIRVTVTKGGYLRGSRLYGTSKTIGRGVAKLRSYIHTKRTYVLTYSRTHVLNVPMY